MRYFLPSNISKKIKYALGLRYCKEQNGQSNGEEEQILLVISRDAHC